MLTKYSFEKIRAKFASYGYKDLVFKYYKSLWEKEPYRSAILLADIFNEYFNELNSTKEYDVSELLYADEGILDEQDHFERDYEVIIIRAICKAGTEISEKETDRYEDFLNYLRNLKKAIFTRIEMHLLSQADDPKYNSRINEIINKYEYFKMFAYENEYSKLINQKKGVLTGDVRKQFIQWVNEIKLDDTANFAEWFRNTRKREHTQDDLEKYENSMRARKLYPVKEVFPDEYENYRTKSGYTDEELKPVPFVGESRWVSGSEGSPKTEEELKKMGAEKVLEYVSDPENYKEPKDGQYRPHSLEGDLAYAFQQVVKEDPSGYLNADIEKILNLPKTFLKKYFYGISDAKKENEFRWDTFLSICKAVTEKYGKDKEYGIVFEPMLWGIRAIFEKENNVKLTEKQLDLIYDIIAKLIVLKEERDEGTETDPMQIKCNSFTGKASEICISLGIICKRDFPEKFEEDFREKIRGIFNKILYEVKTSWTVCIFGSEFARVFWLDSEWVEKNLNAILFDEFWKDVWNTYLKWGRPSVELFKFLVTKGAYEKAIGLIGTYKEKERDPRQDIDNNLANHIVIAYFNGWLEGDESRILEKFLQKAPDVLRGHAARFFTTGFKSLKENPDDAAISRLKAYWESRLEEIGNKPEEHLNEAIELSCWVEDSPFGTKETLKLVSRTLEITQGKLDRNRDIYTFINAVCDAAEGNELTAIRCISQVICNEYMGSHINLFKEKLTKLLNSIMAEDNASVELIEATISLVDDLGRKHVYEYRKLYNDLVEKLKKHKN